MAETKKEESQKTETKIPSVKHFTRNILVKPWITEKSTDLGSQNKYMFLVKGNATKPLIRENISRRYNVNVLGVDVVNIKGKMKHFRNQAARKSGLKKAIITLKKGDKIEIQ